MVYRVLQYQYCRQGIYNDPWGNYTRNTIHFRIHVEYPSPVNEREGTGKGVVSLVVLLLLYRQGLKVEGAGRDVTLLYYHSVYI